MNLEDLQSLDSGPIDNSIIKRDFLKVNHQQGAQFNQSGQNIEFFLGKLTIIIKEVMLIYNLI